MENYNREETLNAIKRLLMSLPFFTEDDTNKTLGSIDFIATGARDRYDASQRLTAAQKKFSKDLLEQLRESAAFRIAHTDYGSWVIPVVGGTLFLPYNLRHDRLISTPDDFYVWIKDNCGVRHKFKRPEDVLIWLGMNDDSLTGVNA